MSAPSARLFAALAPPVEVRSQLAGWARSVRAQSRSAAREGLRLVEEEQLHLTLCFLGARPVGEMQGLIEVVGSFAWAAPELTLGAPLWLPPRRPRALAVEVHDDEDGTLTALHEALARELAGASGWEPERRRLRAHVTVARMREGMGLARLLAPTPALSFRGDRLVLYRSWLSPAGASYEALVERELE